jgi:hypothetical protein
MCAPLGRRALSYSGSLQAQDPGSSPIELMISAPAESSAASSLSATRPNARIPAARAAVAANPV